jgi:hypothetical protein
MLPKKVGKADAHCAPADDSGLSFAAGGLNAHRLMSIHAAGTIAALTVLLSAARLLINVHDAFSSADIIPTPSPQEPLTQIFKASDWRGAIQFSDEGCTASTGEYTLWVYATAAQCGVSREEADRVVITRQPLPGVGPIRAASQLPSGSYVVWVYGAGDAGYPWIRLCGKTCLFGELPTTPGWVSLGWIEIRDNQLLLLRSWQQPVSHRLYVQAVVLSSIETKPDWTP